MIIEAARIIPMMSSSSVTLLASLAGLAKVQSQALQAMSLAGQFAPDPRAREMAEQAAGLILKAKEAQAAVGQAIRQATLDISA
jgi:hypothetical protein